MRKSDAHLNVIMCARLSVSVHALLCTSGAQLNFIMCARLSVIVHARDARE
jgi:hypothetical protein